MILALSRGFDEHPDLLRWAISGIGNDHRLGGHEAPPAIISVFLGDHVGGMVESLITGKPAPPLIDPKLDLVLATCLAVTVTTPIETEHHQLPSQVISSKFVA